jgi:hypothetical protein
MRVAILHHCNEWHEYRSFRLIGVVSETYLQKALLKVKQSLDYTDEELARFVDIEFVEINDIDIYI